MAATLTVADSSIVMTVEGLHPGGVPLQGYSADNVFEFGAVEALETQMGIDGRLSAGFVFNPIQFTVTLSADSPSLPVFESIWTRQRGQRTALDIGVTVATPANGKRCSLRNGYMMSYQAPSGQRILQPAVAVFTFGDLSFSKIG